MAAKIQVQLLRMYHCPVFLGRNDSDFFTLRVLGCNLDLGQTNA